jgi:hypothetical protein
VIFPTAWVADTSLPDNTEPSSASAENCPFITVVERATILLSSSFRHEAVTSLLFLMVNCTKSQSRWS